MEPLGGADQQKESFQSEFFNAALFGLSFDSYNDEFDGQFDDLRYEENVSTDKNLLQASDEELGELINTTLLLDPDYRGPHQENDFQLPALADHTMEGDYFDWVNSDASVIDTEHHTMPNKPFPRFGLDISRDTRHLRGSLIHPNRTKLQEIGQQHTQEVETRKFLTSKSDLPQSCAVVDLSKFPNPNGTNWSTIDLQLLTNDNSKDFLVASKTKLNSIRCIECSFGHAEKVCNGSPCNRCVRIYHRYTTKNFLARDPKLWMPIDTMVFFDIVSTQSLLTALRAETEEIMISQPLDCLEASFNAPIICHIDNRPSHHEFSTSSTPIAVTNLATTRRAASRAYLSDQILVHPALDKVQLDRFVDTQICNISTLQLLPREAGIITTALRCSAYLAILFKWDKHSIFCGKFNLFKSKNLILEIAYSIAYRIQDLIKLVEYEIRESLRSLESRGDPATVSCALWILYRSIKSQHKAHWQASTLRNLQLFLNTFHSRVPAALKALERYRAQVGIHRCQLESRHMKEFLSLINSQTDMNPKISCAFEEHKDYLLNYHYSNIYQNNQSYTSILETQCSTDEMEVMADKGYLYESIRRLADELSDQDTTSNLTDLTEASTASTLSSSVSNDSSILRVVRGLFGTKSSLSSYPLGSQFSAPLSVSSNTQEFSFHGQGKALQDHSEGASDTNGLELAGINPTGDPEKSPTYLASPTAVSRPRQACLSTSMIENPDIKQATPKLTQAGQRKKRDDFKFYNPVTKRFS